MHGGHVNEVKLLRPTNLFNEYKYYMNAPLNLMRLKAGAAVSDRKSRLICTSRLAPAKPLSPSAHLRIVRGTQIFFYLNKSINTAMWKAFCYKKKTGILNVLE